MHLLLPVLTLFASARAQTAAFTRQVECPSDTSLTGYVTLTDLNDDMADELARVVVEGDPPVGGYQLFLCPDEIHDATDGIKVKPVIDNVVIGCGSPTSVDAECIISGSREQVLVEDSAVDGYNLTSIAMEGITFTAFRRTAIKLEASAPTVFTCTDCIFQDFEDTDYIIDLENGSATMTLRLEDAVIQATTGGTDNATADVAFFNSVGGTIEVDGLSIIGARAKANVFALNGGSVWVRNAEISDSIIQGSVGSVVNSGSMSFNSTIVSGNDELQDVFYASHSASSLSLTNVEVIDNLSSTAFHGVMVTGGATLDIADSVFSGNTNVEYMVTVQADSDGVSEALIERTRFLNNEGSTLLEDGVVSAIGNNVGTPYIDMERIDFEGNAEFWGNFMTLFGGRLRIRQTCFQGNSNTFAGFLGFDGMDFTARDNFISGENSAACDTDPDRLSVEAVDSDGCFGGSGSCRIDCVSGLADATTCLSGEAFSDEPSAVPSVVPTLSVAPSVSPSASMSPSVSPQPSESPTQIPSVVPSSLPTSSPSFEPTINGTYSPVAPSLPPIYRPSLSRTLAPRVERPTLSENGEEPSASPLHRPECNGSSSKSSKSCKRTKASKRSRASEVETSNALRNKFTQTKKRKWKKESFATERKYQTKLTKKDPAEATNPTDGEEDMGWDEIRRSNGNDRRLYEITPDGMIRPLAGEEYCIPELSKDVWNKQQSDPYAGEGLERGFTTELRLQGCQKHHRCPMCWHIFAPRKLKKTRILLLLLCGIGCFYQFASLLELQRAELEDSGAQGIQDLPLPHHIAPNGQDRPPRQYRPRFVIDILSIGSKHRLEYLQAQQNTFATHKSVRYFFNVTEENDSDPDCESRLTKWNVKQISRFCRRFKKWNPKRQFLMSYLRNAYATEPWLKRKANAPGWICAQTRPAIGLHRVIQFYNNHDNPRELPDFLIIMDDDTYYNLPLFEQYFQKEYPNSSQPVAVAGCRVRSPTNEINFTIPFGGYGFTVSKGYLQRIMKPIECPRDEPMCRAIRRTNHLDERLLFQNGMSVMDLFHAYATNQSFADVGNWTTGFCLHSDWMWGYMTNFYNASNHVRDPLYANVPHSRMEAYLNSELNAGDPDQGGRRICDFQRGNCHSLAHACHYSTPEEMAAVTDVVRSQYTQQFRSLPSQKFISDSTSKTRPMIDIVSIGSQSRHMYQQAQYEAIGNHSSVRLFINVTEADDPEPRCNGSATFSADLATKLVKWCRSPGRWDLQSQWPLVIEQKWYSHDSPRGASSAQWICQQRLPILGLHKALETYKDSVDVPDFLILAADDTYYNMDTLSEILVRLKTTGKPPVDSRHALAGCLRSEETESDTVATMAPLLRYGIIIPRAVVETLLQPISCPSPDDADSCKRLLFDGIGERQFLKGASSLGDLMASYVVQGSSLGTLFSPTAASCIHGEWLLSWILTWYSTPPAIEAMAKSYPNITKNLHPFLESIMRGEEVKGMCRYEGIQHCHFASSFCARIPPQVMQGYLLDNKLQQNYYHNA